MVNTTAGKDILEISIVSPFGDTSFEDIENTRDRVITTIIKSKIIPLFENNGQPVIDFISRHPDISEAVKKEIKDGFQGAQKSFTTHAEKAIEEYLKSWDIETASENLAKAQGISQRLAEVILFFTRLKLFIAFQSNEYLTKEQEFQHPYSSTRFLEILAYFIEGENGISAQTLIEKITTNDGYSSKPKITKEQAEKILEVANDYARTSSNSPLAKEEVYKAIKSVLEKYNLFHLDRLDKDGVSLTTLLDSLYNYLEMNYLERIPWMSDESWRKIYQKRNVWKDQEIKTAYDKAIEGLGEILDKNKDDKKSAQELAQKIVNEFITEIIKLNIAAELAFNYDLKLDSKKEIEFYLSSLEKKTDSMRIDATAYSIASTQRIFLDKAIKSAKEIFAEAKEWLESALGLNASSSLAQGEDSKVPVFKGGIDLHQDLLDIKTSGASSSIRYNFDPAKLKAISANLAGFEPKIISIKRNGK